jgi:drug/metabolite transporter (DMT)-like permease
MSFIPLATMIPAIFILNQIPTIISVLGILLVTAGAYIIKYSGKRKRYIQAIKIVV